jgi:hypothetical protein
VPQSKYKLADAYVTEQRSLYEAAIAEKQAAIVSENEFVQLLMLDHIPAHVVIDSSHVFA